MGLIIFHQRRIYDFSFHIHNFIDGKTFVEHIRRKFQDQFSISKNDFIVSLNSLESKLIIKQEKTMVGGIPLYIKVKSSIVNSFEGFQSRIRNLQKSRSNQANSKIYIQAKFKDYNLTEFDKVKQLINKCAYDDDLFRLLPFLFRLIFEKLLYQIYLTSLDNNQKFLYFSHRPRDFSQLITLFIWLKDREFHQYHGGSINQEIITILKEVQKKGNLTVHQIIRQIDKEYRDSWRDKIERTLENLLVLYRNLPENKILIEDADRLEKIKEVLGIKKTVQVTKYVTKDLKNQYKSKITEENQGVHGTVENPIQELFALLSSPGIEPHLAKKISIQIKKIGEESSLEVLKFYLRESKTSHYRGLRKLIGNLSELAPESERFLIFEDEFFFVSVRYKRNANRVRIHHEKKKFDYTNPVKNPGVRIAFLKSFRERCEEGGITLTEER